MGNEKYRFTPEELGVTSLAMTASKLSSDDNIQMMGDDLFRRVNEQGCRRLILNFSNVEFMSSAAMGKIIRLHQLMSQVGGKLVLCGISADIMPVFTLTKLDKMLKVVATEEEALAEFAKMPSELPQSSPSTTGVLSDADLLELFTDGLVLGDAIEAIEAEGR